MASFLEKAGFKMDPISWIHNGLRVGKKMNGFVSDITNFEQKMVKIRRFFW